MNGLFVKVGSRLTDYKYEPSPSCSGLQKATFTFTWRVSIGILGQPLLIIAFQHRVWIDSGQLDEVVVGDFPVPASRRPWATRSPSFWLSDVSCYLQGYFTPEILNRIHILWLGGHGPGVVLALPVSDQFSTMTWLTVILHYSYIYANSTTHFSSISMHLVTLTVPSTVSNFTISQNHDLVLTRSWSSEDVSLSYSNTPTWILLEETSSHTCGPSCKQAGSAFIADNHLLQHLTIQAGAPPLVGQR